MNRGTLCGLAALALLIVGAYACADEPEESKASEYAAMTATYEAERDAEIRWSAWSGYEQAEEIDYDAPIPQGICYCDPDALRASVTMTYLGNYYITGYDACAACCGKTDGITASGALAEVGRTVAMCKDYPYGTVIYIDGLGYYTVEDRGVGRGCVDVFCNNHSEAYALTGHYDVYIVEEG